MCVVGVCVCVGVWLFVFMFSCVCTRDCVYCVSVYVRFCTYVFVLVPFVYAFVLARLLVCTV